MSQARYKQKLIQLLDGTGIHLDGPEPWDMQIHDPRVYGRILAHGSLGLGESYMDGWWDAEDL
ncbi:MAG: cyclopropane-fatty-acyl-phospholipid synthase, partial [bacterium]